MDLGEEDGEGVDGMWSKDHSPMTIIIPSGSRDSARDSCVRVGTSEDISRGGRGEGNRR